MKKELDRQLAEANFARERSISSSTLSSETNVDEEEEEEDEDDEEDTIEESNLREDLVNKPDDCAFTSSYQKKCLSNQQVYHLLNNRSDLIKVSKSIQYQINKPNEQMCTSIDLSKHCQISSS